MPSQRQILVLGSGRSGTTWIQDVVADTAQLRPIFEPLHPVAVPAARKLANRRLAMDDNAPDMRRYMDRVFSGELRSIWTDYRVPSDRIRLRPSELLDSGRLRIFYRSLRDLITNYQIYQSSRRRSGLVIKCIRANLMLPWLVRNYNPRVLFIMRHPCAVIASKMKAGAESWSLDGPLQQDLLRRYRSQSAIVQQVAQSGFDLMDPALDGVRLHAVLWCIENVVPVREARRLGCTVAYYERLAGPDEHAWAAVFDALGLDVTPDPAVMKRPSAQAGGERARVGFDDACHPKWREWLSMQQIDDIGDVLKQFGFSDYQVDMAMPVDGNSRI